MAVAARWTSTAGEAWARALEEALESAMSAAANAAADRKQAELFGMAVNVSPDLTVRQLTQVDLTPRRGDP
jgi:hypothetical protein